MDVGVLSTHWHGTGLGSYSRNLTATAPVSEVSDRIRIQYDKRRVVVGNEQTGRVVSKGTRLPVDHPGLFMLRARPALPSYDLYHCAFPGPAIMAPSPTIVTVHDLIKFKYPRNKFEKAIRSVEYSFVQRADHLIANSESTKRDIVNILNYPPEMVTTIHLGVGKQYRPREIDREALRSEWGLPTGTSLALYVGSDEERKNIPTIVQACSQLRDEGVPVHFVKVGTPKDHGDRRRTMTAVERYDMTDHVTFTGRVGEDRLIDLYNLSDVFVFPSEYEGFGLPPLEAMACGTPVVTSNRASLPEVVGEAGLTVDPDDCDSLVNEIAKILTDKQYASDLTDASLSRARQFTWTQTATETARVYERVVS